MATRPATVRCAATARRLFAPVLCWALVGATSRAVEPASAVDAADPTEVAALGRAIEDLRATFGEAYPRGDEFAGRLAALAARLATDGEQFSDRERESRQALAALRREALLANPLLDFGRLLVVKRGLSGPGLGLPHNWESNSSLPTVGYDDAIAVLSLAGDEVEIRTLFQPTGGRFVGDVDLDFDAEKMLFSMPGDNGRWQVFEIHSDGSAPRQLTGEQPDVDSYDACYLPNGKILFTSTACFAGVPCVYGAAYVATLYGMDADGKHIRQLCFDQEHNWCPTILNSGRVMYQRWEYADTPHSNTRLLFQMNPDGTQQGELYGGNSYWPNAMFYARPIPDHPTKIVAVVGGHHDYPRMGELLIFDVSRGRREADGAVQRIPGRGKKVEPLVRDGLTITSWPKFLHPFPLSDKYFLTACQPTPESLWGIYLVDVFDNRTLLKELPDYALFEPIPLRKSPRPPVIAETVNLRDKEGIVYISDIYAGEGLRGIPRGTVKSLRVFTYHFAYQNMGGLLGVVGMDGPWDIKRVLGTVPVQEDGSAKFRVPANTPISLQPLDAQGRALQLMRSWMTAMPGERVSCVGCHASPHDAPRSATELAQSPPIADITPWYGPTRGFSYAREVQPVIDRYCVACHDGRGAAHGLAIPDLRGEVRIADWRSATPGNGGAHAGKFSVGYAELHRYVRRPGIESDYHLLEPMEFHAGTTELVQMLEKGHHGVQLDAEAWDRLNTWIDLNCPFHGTWGEELDDPGSQPERRRELGRRYAGLDDDPEAVPPPPSRAVEPQTPQPLPVPNVAPIACPDWPLEPAEAQRRQRAAGAKIRRALDLGDGIALEMVLIPAGEFVMGSASGPDDERPPVRIRIERPFWIGLGEVTNAQYQRFDPTHDSRVESKNAYQFGIHGYPVNEPSQPVVRVSWTEAKAFCEWLATRVGRGISLPSERQWEYACRAGSATPMSFGDENADFSPFANLADATLSKFASDPYTVDRPLVDPSKYDDWIPKDSRYEDGAVLSLAPGRYRPNAWGVFDMHGNVAEWTGSDYAPDSQIVSDGRKTVRGGSWRDRPARATASFRLAYAPYQRVFNVGFRIVCEADPE